MTKPLDPKGIFQDAMELGGAERAAFLAGACGGDAAVRARVDALLAAEAHAGAFLTSPTAGAGASGPQHEQAGTVIGHYRLLERLGEGGFGTVWRAEQSQPVRRQVALKVVKRGMDTRSVVARFEQERQALAMMDHPNIAKVFDGGETRAGRSYFVMELVHEGVPVTQFCDARHLDANQRLSLFVQVCHAVQHAHQKGIIHRDLKPSNVLVTLQDGVPVPKVIDFGIAKAVHRPLTEKTLLTELQQMIGTPEYMSPEQAELSGRDIDTRADIYSLGVLLYELLTGTLPFAGRTGAPKGILELLRVIREEEPPKPSTRISTLGERSTEVATRRRTDPRRLKRLLRGDLDWIVMKAMEKDRGRRYATPAELAADIGRHLAYEPVAARSPSLGYRMRKLARRRRGAVAAVLALAVTLGAGVAGTLWFAVEAHRQAGIAVARLAEFELMQTLALWEQAVADEAALDPAEPERIPAMRAWLTAHLVLLDRRPRIAATLRDLEARALPATAVELEQDRQQHPKAPLLANLAADLAGERRAQAVRDGAVPATVELTADERALPPMQLGQMAWERVAPDHERTQHGEEARGLALAQAALAAPESPDAPRHSLLDTLAWALFANGRDSEAVDASHAALAAAPAEQRPALEGPFLQRLQQRIADVAGAGGHAYLARREAELAALAAEVATRRTFRFDSPADLFLYKTLQSLAEKLDSLAAGPAVAVAQRLRWAERIDDLTRAHPRAAVSWSEAAAAIAAGDGQRASTAYRGRGIALTPQRGLVPIGKNSSTGLWEFYDLRSAWDGQEDPANLPIPRHAPDGSIPITPATGIVFVLLPGGDVAIGAQRDPQGVNYDQQAVPAMGPVRVHPLAPFFLARHELTQGQWARLWTGDPALRRPSYFNERTNVVGAVALTTGLVTDSNPVESVDWSMCAQLLARHALAFPTEAQWEYACRAGTTQPWSCAREELVRHANLADATARMFAPEWDGFEPWNDECFVHVGVGHFQPNAFGMHDMHGNVYEWCADGRSGTHGPGGEREVGTAGRGICGGAFDSTADDARSAFRRQPPVLTRAPNLGLRAARPLR